MSIDVLTLFPEWFDWMRRPRHLANAAETGGLEIRCFNPRDHTPLGQGQVLRCIEVQVLKSKHLHIFLRKAQTLQS